MQAAGWLIVSISCVLLGCAKTPSGQADGDHGPPVVAEARHAPPAAPSSAVPAPSASSHSASSLPASSHSASARSAGGPRAAAPKRRYVVAALGDSITDQRVGGGGYLRKLRELCPQSEFLDFGKGGDMTNQMRRRFEAEIVPLAQSGRLTTLLLYGGVNDLYSDLTAGRTNDRIEADLSAIYRRSHDLKLEIVAVTVSPWGGFTRYFNARRSDSTRLLNSWILSQVGRGAIDHAVDSYPRLSCGDAEKLCPDYETRGHDGLHPGPKGHAILAEALWTEAFSDCE